MYPSPYQSPGVSNYYAAPPNLLGPARRASLLMFIVGPIILLLGTCAVSLPTIMKKAPSPEFTQFREQMEKQAGPGNLDASLIVSGTLAIAVALTMIIMAVFVRRGGRGSCILATVMAAILVLYSAGSILLSLVTGAFGGACMAMLMLGIFTLLVVWLAQAIKAAGNLKIAQQQYAAQYWHYQQTMQAHGNAGYGYGTQSTAPPPQNPDP